MRIHLPLVVGLVALLSIACGGDAGSAGSTVTMDAPPSHCDSMTFTSACVDYLDDSGTAEDCKAFETRPTPGACPATGRTLRCQMEGKIRKYYNVGTYPRDAAAADSHCKNSMGGTPM